MDEDENAESRQRLDDIHLTEKPGMMSERAFRRLCAIIAIVLAALSIANVVSLLGVAVILLAISLLL